MRGAPFEPIIPAAGIWPGPAAAKFCKLILEQKGMECGLASGTGHATGAFEPITQLVLNPVTKLAGVLQRKQVSGKTNKGVSGSEEVLARSKVRINIHIGIRSHINVKRYLLLEHSQAR